jgi:Arc/MetJ-type ribon-helix-helix transcriptional regulator
MVRTQIYLSEEQKQDLERLAASTGKRKSELIRDAIDGYLVQHKPKHKHWLEALEPLFGMWADRTDLDDFVPKLRRAADERLKRLWPAS